MSRLVLVIDTAGVCPESQALFQAVSVMARSAVTALLSPTCGLITPHSTSSGIPASAIAELALCTVPSALASLAATGALGVLASQASCLPRVAALLAALLPAASTEAVGRGCLATVARCRCEGAIYILREAVATSAIIPEMSWQRIAASMMKARMEPTPALTPTADAACALTHAWPAAEEARSSWSDDMRPVNALCSLAETAIASLGPFVSGLLPRMLLFVARSTSVAGLDSLDASSLFDVRGLPARSVSPSNAGRALRALRAALRDETAAAALKGHVGHAVAAALEPFLLPLAVHAAPLAAAMQADLTARSRISPAGCLTPCPEALEYLVSLPEASHLDGNALKDAFDLLSSCVTADNWSALDAPCCGSRTGPALAGAHSTAAYSSPTGPSAGAHPFVRAAPLSPLIERCVAIQLAICPAEDARAFLDMPRSMFYDAVVSQCRTHTVPLRVLGLFAAAVVIAVGRSSALRRAALAAARFVSRALASPPMHAVRFESSTTSDMARERLWHNALVSVCAPLLVGAALHAATSSVAHLGRASLAGHAEPSRIAPPRGSIARIALPSAGAGIALACVLRRASGGRCADPMTQLMQSIQSGVAPLVLTPSSDSAAARRETLPGYQVAPGTPPHSGDEEATPPVSPLTARPSWTPPSAAQAARSSGPSDAPSAGSLLPEQDPCQLQPDANVAAVGVAALWECIARMPSIFAMSGERWTPGLRAEIANIVTRSAQQLDERSWERVIAVLVPLAVDEADPSDALAVVSRAARGELAPVGRARSASAGPAYGVSSVMGGAGPGGDRSPEELDDSTVDDDFGSSIRPMPQF